MKKVLFLLLVTSISYGQALFDKGVKITGGITTDNTATKLVVQSANNVLNTILKDNLIDVVIVNTTAELTSGIGNINKLYATRDNTIIYRYNGTIYVPLTQDISGKEDVFNKSSSFTLSSTVTYANTKALVDGLATKQNTISGTTNVIPKFGTGGLVSSLISEISGGIDVNGNAKIKGMGATSLATTITASALKTDYINNPGQGLFIGNLTASGGITKYIQSANFNGLTANGLSLNTYGGGVSIGKELNIGEGILEVNGAITASPATLSNQVVVKSQLDLKADLASPSLTGTPTAPTATAGTNTTQVANTAFVLANTNANGLLEFNLTDRTVWNNGKSDVATNTSFGNGALIGNTTGGTNTAIGGGALSTNTTGSSNVSVGNSSGNVSGGTVLDNSVFIGVSATPQGNNQTNQIAIGHNTTGAGSNTATLGNASITSTILRGTVQAGNATALNHLITKAQTLYTNQTITANKTVTISEFVNNNELILRVNATAGNITVTLPTFTALQGYKVTVRKVDSSANSVLIQSVGGVNIDGAATLTVSGQYGKATIGADLVQYIIL